MSGKFLSRRSMLRGAAALGLTPLLSSLASLFPEAGVVFARSRESLPGFLHAPKDLIGHVIDGAEAEQLVERALGDADVVSLRAALPGFETVVTEAKVSAAVWARGTRDATIVGIPLVGPNGAEAALYQFAMSGERSAFVVEFPDPSDRGVATLHTVANGVVRRV